MGLDDQVTCYSGTSARAVNHSDASDRSMETEYEKLMQRGAEEGLPSCLSLGFDWSESCT